MAQPLVTLTRTVGLHRFVVDVGTRFRGPAEALLDAAVQLVDEGHVLGDGSEVVFGWWPFTLADEGGDLRLLAPDAVGGDRRDVTKALGLMALQFSTCERVGVDPFGHAVDALVNVAPGTLAGLDVMLARQPDPLPGDTGWHLRPDGPLQVYEEAYTPIPLADVLERRPGLAAPLALPPGFIVRMANDRIVAVLDGEGRDHWHGDEA